MLRGARCWGVLGWGGSLGALEPEGGREGPLVQQASGTLEEPVRPEGRTGEQRREGQEGPGRLQPESCACGVGGLVGGGMKDAVGSENVCVSSGQTTPTLSAARQAGTFGASGERAKEPGRAINLRQDLLHPKNPTFSSHLWGGAAGTWGSLRHSSSSPCRRRSPQERPSSGPQGSCRPPERGRHAMVHFGESLAEIISQNTASSINLPAPGSFVRA